MNIPGGGLEDVLQPLPVVVLAGVHLNTEISVVSHYRDGHHHLVCQGQVAPGNDHLLVCVVCDVVGALRGDGDTLPLGAPVLRVVQAYNWSPLQIC